MSDGIEWGRKCEVVGRAGWGYNGVVRWRDYEAVGRAWDREFGLQTEPGWQES